MNEVDPQGCVPLLMLGRCVYRTLLTVASLEALMVNGNKRGRRPIDWNIVDANGNTTLHLAFAIEAHDDDDDDEEYLPRRHGKPIQTLAATLARVNSDDSSSPTYQSLLANIDLLARNRKGESVLELIATHCLDPQSMRGPQGGFNWWAFRTSPFNH
jgi:hypothetical protein